MNDRNPDINTDEQEVPPDYYIHEGQKLQRYARIAKVPFGVATKIQRIRDGTGKSRVRAITIGLVIRNSDRQRMEDALPNKELTPSDK